MPVISALGRLKLASLGYMVRVCQKKKKKKKSVLKGRHLQRCVISGRVQGARHSKT
jgi:hypothetical protein